MGQYRIAELNVDIATNSATLQEYLVNYETQYDCTPNLILSITDDRLLLLMEENEGYTADKIECNYIATKFSRELFDFNGFPINSIAVENEDKCVLFSSPFEKEDLLPLLPSDKIFEVDFPAVRQINENFFVYDTPFGERAMHSKSRKLPMSSIVFVDSNRFDSLRKLEAVDFVPCFLRSVSINIYDERTKHTLYVLEKLMKAVDFYGVGSLDDIDFILERV